MSNLIWKMCLIWNKKNSFSLDSFQELCNAHSAQAAHVMCCRHKVFAQKDGCTFILCSRWCDCFVSTSREWLCRCSAALDGSIQNAALEHLSWTIKESWASPCVCAGVCIAFTVIKPWWSVQLSLSVNYCLCSAFIESRRWRVGELCRWLCEGKTFSD